MPDPVTPSTETATPPPQSPLRQCRSLTVRGRQCMSSAMHGHQFCSAHLRYRFPVCPQGDKVAIPLLEDLDTVQVVATQVAHGLFAQTLDPWRAGKILYALQVAALTIPRPAPLKPSDEKPVVNEPVNQVFTDLDGHLLGPDVLWKGYEKSFNPLWSYDRHRWVEECKRLGKPIPLTPEEFPAEGWLTKDEMDEYNPHRPDMMRAEFLDRTLEMRLEEDRLGKLPPLYKRECSYFGGGCKGPWDMGRRHSCCDWCQRERKERIRVHPEEDIEVVRCPSELETSDDPYGLQPRVRTDMPRLSVTNRCNAYAHGPALTVARAAQPAVPSEPSAPTDLNAAAQPASPRAENQDLPVSNSTTSSTRSFQIPIQPRHTQGGGGRSTRRARARRAKRAGIRSGPPANVVRWGDPARASQSWAQSVRGFARTRRNLAKAPGSGRRSTCLQGFDGVDAGGAAGGEITREGGNH
jgi:hypothetical protein